MALRPPFFCTRRFGMTPVRTRTAVLSAILLALVLTARTPAADPARIEDLKYLPSDIGVVMSVRMDRLLASDVLKKLRKDTPIFLSEFEPWFKKEFGIEVSH